MRAKHSKHAVDVLLGVGLLLLMSYQVTGEAGHEWTGIVMTVLMILHQMPWTRIFQKWSPKRAIPVRNRTGAISGALPLREGFSVGGYDLWIRTRG